MVSETVIGLLGAVAGAAVKHYWPKTTPVVNVLFPPVPPERKVCASCHGEVPIWHTTADGLVRCTRCLYPDPVA